MNNKMVREICGAKINPKYVGAEITRANTVHANICSADNASGM